MASIEKANSNHTNQGNSPQNLKKTPRITKLILIYETVLFLVSLLFILISLQLFLAVFLIGSFLFFFVLSLVSLFSKHLRPTFWLPMMFICCSITLVLSIIVLSLPLAVPAVIPVVQEPVEEEPAVEEPVVEEPEEQPPAPEPVEEQPAETSIRDCISSIIETINEWLRGLGLEIPLPEQG